MPLMFTGRVVVCFLMCYLAAFVPNHSYTNQLRVRHDFIQPASAYTSDNNDDKTKASPTPNLCKPEHAYFYTDNEKKKGELRLRPQRHDDDESRADHQ